MSCSCNNIPDNCNCNKYVIQTESESCNTCDSECPDMIDTKCIVWTGGDYPLSGVINMSTLNAVVDSLINKVESVIEGSIPFVCSHLNTCSIGNLGDVNLTNIINGQILIWETDTFIPYTLPTCWTTSGNDISTGDYIGTNNNESLIFKVNQIIWGHFDHFKNNLLLGRLAGNSITTGTNNTIIGCNSGEDITTGINNTIIGANITGLDNNLSNNIILADGNGTIRLRFDNSLLKLNGPSVNIYANEALTHKIEIEINGSTYYLIATNV